MKATELLKEQHKEVADLFKQIEEASTEEKQLGLFEELATKLVAHDAMERQLLYPRCVDKLGMNDVLAESMVEHGIIEFGLYGAIGAVGGDEFEPRCKVLKELVEHHVEEEEDQLFSLMKDGFSAEELEELGTQLEAKFQEALKKDVNRALSDNLTAVLAGTMNPTPKNGAKKAPAKTQQTRSR